MIGLGAFVSLHDVEFDIVAFLEAFIAVGLNRAVVHEHVWTVVAANKSETLGIVKPLHFSLELSHEEALPSIQIGTARIPCRYRRMFLRLVALAGEEGEQEGWVRIPLKICLVARSGL